MTSSDPATQATPATVGNALHPAWQDDERETHVITEVRESGGWFDVTQGNGWSCGVDGQHGVTPAIGDMLTLWGHGIGSPFRGQAIGSHVLWYRTEDEDREHHRVEQATRDEASKATYAASLDDHTRRIRALPMPFLERITWFRGGNPDWGWRHEAYELFTCEEAVKIATAFPDCEQIAAFHAAPYAQQREMLPSLSEDHSGNTFGVACQLAAHYLQAPDTLWQAHGALCPLVGCGAYGCYAARKEVAPPSQHPACDPTDAGSGDVAEEADNG